jgi:hypothetical protein
MKRLTLPLVVLMLLTACSSQKTAKFQLQFDVDDANVRQNLTLASIRVIERRLELMGATMIDKQIETKNDQVTLGITLEEKEAVSALTEELITPFHMRVMKQTGSGETADLSVQGQGNFSQTGVTEQDLQWVETHRDADGKGEVALLFTDEGKSKMLALFKKMVGKNIGIFVRDRLVSKLHVATDKFPDNIVISGIPSFDLAEVFADDMNVGLHVIFTPVP